MPYFNGDSIHLKLDSPGPAGLMFTLAYLVVISPEETKNNKCSSSIEDQGGSSLANDEIGLKSKQVQVSLTHDQGGFKSAMTKKVQVPLITKDTLWSKAGFFIRVIVTKASASVHWTSSHR